MNHKHIRHSIGRKLDDLQRSLIRTTGKFDGEDVHLFRVKIKKWRAFLTLLSAEDPQHAYLTNNGRARLPLRLRRFYRMTGEIRNRQLQLQRIKEYWKDRKDALPRTYINRLETELAETMTRAGEYATKRSPLKAARERLHAGMPHQLHRRSVKRLLRKRTDGLEALLATPQPWEDSLFHSIRKTLKDLQYMQPDLPPGILPKIPLKEKKMGSLTDSLGAVQDSCTALELLDDRYLDPIPEGEENNELATWKKYWQAEKDRCKQVVYAQLQETGLLSPGQGQHLTTDPAERAHH